MSRRSAVGIRRITLNQVSLVRISQQTLCKISAMGYFTRHFTSGLSWIIIPTPSLEYDTDC